jgi:hypothetical protein
MSRAATRRSWIFLWVCLAGGCSSEARSPAGRGADDADKVREQFVAFQNALQARDGERIWGLLDSDSRADAERAAKTAQSNYERGSPEEKDKLKEALGLTDAELAKLTATGFLKSNRFHGKYHEIPGSKIDDVKVQGEEAIVSYTEADGDKEKLTFHRRDGQWRISVRMP